VADLLLYYNGISKEWFEDGGERDWEDVFEGEEEKDPALLAEMLLIA
jgi:hypothetical protein